MKNLHQRIPVTLFAIYLIVMTGIMVWQGIGITPDRFAVGLIVLSLFLRRTKKFLLDWSPFMFILLSYDYLRGFADSFNTRVYYLPQIRIDEYMFGILPSIALQQLFFTADTIHWYDYFATVLYFLHFALPLGFGYILWLKDRALFRSFILGLLILSYSAFATYVIFPSSPPWLANNEGYISGITKIMDITLGSFPEQLGLPTIYHNFNPNKVAAIPSLHAAYPALVFLFALQVYKRKGLIFLPYLLAVWISIVYLGEHYVFDVIIGALYASASYGIAKYLSRFNLLAPQD